MCGSKICFGIFYVELGGKGDEVVVGWWEVILVSDILRDEIVLL